MAVERSQRASHKGHLFPGKQGFKNSYKRDAIAMTSHPHSSPLAHTRHSESLGIIIDCLRITKCLFQTFSLEREWSEILEIPPVRLRVWESEVQLETDGTTL